VRRSGGNEEPTRFGSAPLDDAGEAGPVKDPPGLADEPENGQAIPLDVGKTRGEATRTAEASLILSAQMV
jgi:hypothetical protein